VIPGKVPMNLTPTRILGQPQTKLVSGAPNLVEGRELSSPTDVAVDTTNKMLYVADTANNRVLGWKLATLATGAPADLVVGQNDRYSTLQGGPGTSRNSGLLAPTSLAVDGNGNLYVADSGNNRILRYRQPFMTAPGDPVLADFAIGQTSVSTGRSANAGGLSATSLFFSSSTTVLTTGIRFDSDGNLWVCDAGNGRLLRYPASLLADGKPSGPAADLVIGQSSFTVSVTPVDAKSKITLQQPAALAFDNSGRLFVTDLANRVLVFAQPFSNGMSAQRIMGATKPPAQGQPAPTVVNEYTVGAQTAGQGNLAPTGVFTIGNIPFVVDQSANRILRFPAYEQWPIESDSFSPAAAAVIGQSSLRQTTPLINRGLPDAGPDRFALPGGAVSAGGKVYVADTGNNRVLVFNDLSTGPISGGANDYLATLVLGQVDFAYNGRNLVEGREFSGPNGVAVYTTADGTPQLFVADTNNNRILGFRDARKVKPGDQADLVIGQVDFSRVLVNSPLNLPTDRNSKSLYAPRAVAVDKAGNLWVADTGNARVLRYPPPFSPTFDGSADLVLGQSGFTVAVTDPSSRTMAAPAGLAFTFEGLLTVADAAHNRVLVFIPPFTSGMAASKVIGQPNFVTTGAGTTLDSDKFNQPRGLATDSDDRLYVADFGNNRVQVFGRVPLLSDNPAAVLTLRTNPPIGVAVSKLTGEVWALEQSGGMRRFPKFDTLFAIGDQADYLINADTGGGLVSNAFLSATFDQFNNLYTGEGANRVSVFYPKVSVCNGASFVSRTLAPGIIASATTAPDRGCEGGEDLVYQFTDKTRVFNELANPLPLPRTLEDLQVLINGTPAPLYFISPFQINFLVPNNAPTTGTLDLQIYQPSTGRVIAASQVPMATASPGLFTTSFEKGTANALAQRQIAAINEDGTVNSKTNPVPPGKFVSLYATGVGFIPNAPADGAVASGLLPSPAHLRVALGTTVVEPGPDLQYSGLAPGLVSVWQINVRVPTLTAPGAAVIGLSVDDITGNPLTRVFGFNTYIWVK